MKVKDAMHKGVDWVSPDTPVTELAKLMCEHDIGAIPIGENDRLIGMVTDRDIVVRALADRHFKFGTRARAVMSEKMFYCFADQEVDDVLENMGELQVRRMPVVDRAKRLVGIVTIRDLSDRAPRTKAGDSATLRPVSH